MGWVDPSTFANSTGADAAPLNAISNNLNLLKSSLQIAGIGNPLVGTQPPALDEPNFVTDWAYQSNVNGVTTSASEASFFFTSAFPNGVGAIVCCPSDGATVPGMTVQLVRGATTLSGFTVVVYGATGGGNYGPVGSGLVVNVSWVAIGW